MGGPTRELPCEELGPPRRKARLSGRSFDLVVRETHGHTEYLLILQSRFSADLLGPRTRLCWKPSETNRVCDCSGILYLFRTYIRIFRAYSGYISPPSSSVRARAYGRIYIFQAQFRFALALESTWVRDQYFPDSYAHATWLRLAPFFRLPGTVVSDATTVHVEFRPFNDRALNRDLISLCERVNSASPRLPDGRRLCFTLNGSCRILPASNLKVA